MAIKASLPQNRTAPCPALPAPGAGSGRPIFVYFICITTQILKDVGLIMKAGRRLRSAWARLAGRRAQRRGLASRDAPSEGVDDRVGSGRAEGPGRSLWKRFLPLLTKKLLCPSRHGAG